MFNTIESEKDLFTPKNVTDARAPEQNPGYGFCSSIAPTLSWDGDILGVTINSIVRELDEAIQESVIERYALDFTELRQFLEHKRAQRNNGWISVKDRPPKQLEPSMYNGWSKEIKPSETVLCFTNNKEWFVGWYSYTHGNWTDVDEVYTTTSVTHWMPLPEAPKGDAI